MNFKLEIFIKNLLFLTQYLELKHRNKLLLNSRFDYLIVHRNLLSKIIFYFQ